MNFCVIFGGKSFEHEISIISAITLKNILKNQISFFVFCDFNNNFFLINHADMHVNFFAKHEYKHARKLSLRRGGFFYKNFLKTHALDPKITINLIHGHTGEDGILPALLDFYAINFIGPRTDASVISFSKELTKIYAQNLGIDTLMHDIFTKNSPQILKNTSFPVIVKPVRAGSSLGVSLARDERELIFALEMAFAYDERALAEPYLENVRECNLAGVRISGSEFIFSRIEEPKKTDFLTFADKYLDFSRDETVPAAQISEGMAQKLRDTFVKIYGDLFSGALIRCDFFVYENRVILNEINPVPGSLAHYLFDDFAGVLMKLSGSTRQNLQNFPQKYSYINAIKKAK